MPMVSGSWGVEFDSVTAFYSKLVNTWKPLASIPAVYNEDTDAMGTVKRQCRLSGKPFIPLRTSSDELSRIARLLRAEFDDHMRVSLTDDPSDVALTPQRTVQELSNDELERESDLIVSRKAAVSAHNTSG
jgi:hypothetical protein